MAGNVNSGKRRTPLPKGKEAEEELARIRRNQRRAERRARKKAEQEGRQYDAGDEFDTDTPPPADGTLKPPTLEEIKADMMFAFNELGGRAGLVSWGRRYPKEFYALWMKYCAPKEDDDQPEVGSLESMLAQLDRRKETVQ